MASNPVQEGYPDDFLEQILAIPAYTSSVTNDVGSSREAASLTTVSQLGSAVGGLQQLPPLFPLGLSLDNGRSLPVQGSRERDTVNMGSVFPVFEQLNPHSTRNSLPQIHQGFQGQPTSSTTVTVPHPPTLRPRVRARRGQATDPHSIAERLRRERISERIKALQELVPSCNKSDRAAMLDEILDYVKFLRLQVKVLSMSRLGGAGAVAQLVADVPLQSVQNDGSENGSRQHLWEEWSNEDTEKEVVKLMEEDFGAAMQFLQSKSLCIMPISLANLIYPSPPPDETTTLS